MTSIQAFKHLIQSLLDLYEPNEAVSMAAIVMEDAFGILPKHISNNLILLPEQQQHLDALLARLLLHEPVQYVVGKTVFYGVPLRLSSAVLIPRQETEELVAWVLETVASRQSTAYSQLNPLRLLDIGTGSGCIPIALKKKRPELEVHALDVSPSALEVARENASVNHTPVEFHEVDILEESGWQALPVFDIIVSNPPYITEDERDTLPKNVVDFEPHLALFSGGQDAQRFVKKIVEFASQHLKPGGWLFFETNEFYAPDTQRILAENGFTEVELRQDLNKKDRMVRGRRG